MKVLQWEVPHFEDGDLESIEIVAASGDLDLKFNVTDIPGSPGLRFTKVRGYRVRMEAHCTGWHVEDCHMKLVQISDSSYAQELMSDTSPGRATQSILNHYLIFVQDYGCVEVICDDWEPYGWPE